ncbi:LOW QUALITY PROTEIN: transcription regulator protein BACH1 [Salarias fasciatus]|uniref:LOW QUALITY PROTEIN: transcription regulator protein BACH1 n=1 Tax=Salarias fasciatus TaxID=181472 RepID=UPI003F58B9A1
MSLMAMSALRSSMFTFESTVHSCHMLRCLDEQRRSDVLCDVTVVVEGQSFRAHRSVLASCSEYFTQKFASFMQHGAVITLPEEVTVEGFEPLLNFAYTSKLLFGKDDVLEIRNAASILGFQDLDEGCFDFVLPKFFSGSKSSAPFLGKICCKKKCKRRLSKQDSGSDCDCVLLDEKEVKPVADSSAPQEATWNCDRSVNNKMGSRRSPDTDAHVVEESNDHVRQCPKYRKFQIACGKENCITEKNPTAPDVPISDEGLFSFSPCSSSEMNHIENFYMNSTSNVCKQGAGDGRDVKTKTCIRREETHLDKKETNTRERKCEDMEIDVIKLESDIALITGRSSTDMSTVKAVFSEPKTARAERSAGLILNRCSPLNLNEGPAMTRSLAQGGVYEGENASEPSVTEPASFHRRQEEQVETEDTAADQTRKTSGIQKSALSGNGMSDRNMAEGDKTQKPATAPGPDACSSQLHLQDPHADSSDRGSGCGQSTSLEWLKLRSSFSPPRSSCPAFQDPLQGKCVWKGPGLSECEGASQSGVSSLNSGEDGDSETETEGDSEFYSQERARQVQLPFSVDWIVNLNRNDFQQLLKQQVFTGEQLECVHDMRRRSKNRLAAQRCRKRKLDCIYNLQCEINKLKTEREKLMMEKSQLSQLKTKACHSVSALCQRVCSEANLHPEQVQVLAKYTTPDCPLASFFPHIDTLLSQHGPPHGRAPEEPQFTPSTDTFMGQQ